MDQLISYICTIAPYHYSGLIEPETKNDEMYIDTSLLEMFDTPTGWEHVEYPNMPNTT